MKRKSTGFTLLEVTLAVLVLLVAATAIVPIMTKNLILGRVLWERRLVMRVIETELAIACDAVLLGTGFNTLVPATVSTPWPQELNSPIGARTVICLNASLDEIACPESPDLKQVVVAVQWTSDRRIVTETSAPYLISKAGVCGTGA